MYIALSDHKKLLQYSLEAASTALNASTVQEAWAWFESQLEIIGADHVSMVFNFPTRQNFFRFAHRNEILGTMISTEWHLAMADHPEWIENDPILPRALASERAIFTKTGQPGYLTKSPQQKEFIWRLRDFGMSLGVGIPIHNRIEGSLSVLLYGWQRDGERPTYQYTKYIERPIRQLATYFNEGLLLRSRIEDAPKFSLSPRESECLSWAAIGKTTSQIADILSLTDATVNAYISSAAKKLGASNRTQACTRAFLLSLMKP